LGFLGASLITDSPITFCSPQFKDAPHGVSEMSKLPLMLVYSLGELVCAGTIHLSI